MPVTNTSTVAFVLTGISVDMRAGSILAQFTRLLNGEPLGTTEMTIEGEELGVFLSSSPDPSKTRGNDFTDAIYTLALSRGIISGVIS